MDTYVSINVKQHKNDPVAFEQWAVGRKCTNCGQMTALAVATDIINKMLHIQIHNGQLYKNNKSNEFSAGWSFQPDKNQRRNIRFDRGLKDEYKHGLYITISTKTYGK